MIIDDVLARQTLKNLRRVDPAILASIKIQLRPFNARKRAWDVPNAKRNRRVDGVPSRPLHPVPPPAPEQT